MDIRKLGTFSPLRYPGGKGVLARFIADIVAKERLHSKQYVEPYAGGAGVGLALLLLEKVERIVINDLDPAVYSFWNSVVLDNGWYIERISNVPLSVTEWRRQQDIYRHQEAHSEREIGFAFFYLNRTNRSGILDGCPIGGIAQTGAWKIDARFNRATLSERVRNIGEYGVRISVRRVDGAKLIRDCLEDDDCFVYADPPYFEKGGSLYLNHFGREDHLALAKCLNYHSSKKWLLTYDNVDEVKELYSDRKMMEFSLRYSAHTAKIGSEVLVSSDSLASAAIS